MSDTTNTQLATDIAIATSNSGPSLTAKAEANPAVMSNLQNVFDSISHGGALAPLVPFIAAWLVQNKVNIDPSTLLIICGLASVVFSYAWQKISIMIRKPAAVAP
jgi:hypothetical protein